MSALDPAVRAVSAPLRTVIDAEDRWKLGNLVELRGYWDLLRFLTWRHVRVRYAQSALGIGWAVVQPLASVLVFTLVFGKMAGVSSNGSPYALFAFVAILPWNYFSGAVTDGAASLVTQAALVRKIYFPRIILPASVILAKLVDFVIGAILLTLVLLFKGYVPSAEAWCLPLLVLLMIITSAGLAVWLTALAVQYRDVNHASGFMVQLLMYAAPVVYPTTLVPEGLRLLYALNPLVGVIEGFRAVLLGVGGVPWGYLAVGTVSAVTLFVTGTLYFHRREHLFSDVA